MEQPGRAAQPAKAGVPGAGVAAFWRIAPRRAGYGLFAANACVPEHCQAGALSRPLRRTEYHIGPQRGDPGRAEPGQRALPHARSLFLAEGVHGGAVTRPEHDVPELVRVVEVV